MNHDLAKVLKEYATVKSLNYRRVKAQWCAVPVPKRGDLRQAVEKELATLAKAGKTEEGRGKKEEGKKEEAKGRKEEAKAAKK